MSHASVPYQFWEYAFETAVHLINRTPTPLLNNLTPWQTLFNTPPEISHLKVFGCTIFPYLRPYAPHKLAPRSQRCIFLGYPLGYRGYRCYCPSTGKIYIVADAVFDEHTFPFADPPALPPSSDAPPVHVQLPLPPLDTLLSTAATSNLAPTSSSIEPTSGTTSPISTTPSADSPRTEELDTTNSSSSHMPTEVPRHPMVTRLRDGTIPRRVLTNNQTFALTTSTQTHKEPTCYTQASRDPNWRAAMAAEYDALIKNGTWELVPPSPHVRPIGCKWIYKIKLRSDGSLERYKAQLVAKGYHQQPGIDYTETFSPVAKLVTIRMVLAVAYSRGWSIRQLDVSNAFLHGHLSEEVYMTQPQGFVDPHHPTHVCRLRRSLYGLKQAPRAWYQRLSSYLLKIGFSLSSADSSLFIMHTPHYHIFLLVYVDDIILTGSPHALLQALLNTLHGEFAIKDLGPLHYFLGMEVQNTSIGLLLNQTKFTQEILQRSKMTEAKAAPTPCTTDEPLSINSGDPMPDPALYRSIVGALQYLTLTRPDIAYSVNIACQFLHAPTTMHWQAVKRILRYLADTPQHGLLFTRTSSNALHAFSYASWAGDRDDRRSVGGFCIYLGSNLISWSSRKQRTVARSSTEAEYKSLADTTAELIWIEFLLKDLQDLPPHPPTLWCDNLSAIYLTANPVFHARTKHVEIDFHFIRERLARHQLTIHYISSVDQPADIFTKGLSSTRFRMLRSKLTVHTAPSACGRMLARSNHRESSSNGKLTKSRELTKSHEQQSRPTVKDNPTNSSA